MNDISPEQILDNAFQLLETGQGDQALALFADVTQVAPENPEGWFMRGAITGDQGNLADAEAWIRKAIELDGEYADAHLGLAKLLESQGQTDAAIASCMRAVNADEEYGDAWLLMSALAGKSGRNEEAENCSRRAVDLLPDNADAHLNLANALVSRGEFQQATNHFNRSLELRPGDPRSLASLASMLFGTGNHEQAAERLAFAIRADAELLDSQIDVAFAFIENGNLDAAKGIEQVLSEIGIFSKRLRELQKAVA